MQTIKSLLLAVTLCVFAGSACARDEPANKAVLVTGASSGIGLKIAETLAANGYYVYAGARKAEDLARLDAMDNISAVRLDVTIQADIDAAVDFVRSRGRGLWGIVNNAGIVRYAPLVDGPESDFRLTFDVNVMGPYRINQAFLPLVIESGGRTAVIGSINGFVASPGIAGYAASKFAMEGYTDSLAGELANAGVHVAIVEPGAYKSNIRATMLEAAVERAESGDLDLDENTRTSLARSAERNETYKEPDEVAEAVLHLMSSDNPKRRYLVSPNPEQAEMAIRSALRRALQLNEGQPYTYTRDELVAMLDELLDGDD
jgi:NAD(P)-dependent dehydrogenase (short-subunit alcohol dehydrogenase family)